MFLRIALRSVAALAVASTGLLLGVATALACEPMAESTGRSGIWPVAPAAVVPSSWGPDGMADWAFGAALLVVAAATVAFHRGDEA